MKHIRSTQTKAACNLYRPLISCTYLGTQLHLVCHDEYRRHQSLSIHCYYPYLHHIHFSHVETFTLCHCHHHRHPCAGHYLWISFFSCICIERNGFHIDADTVFVGRHSVGLILVSVQDWTLNDKAWSGYALFHSSVFLHFYEFTCLPRQQSHHRRIFLLVAQHHRYRDSSLQTNKYMATRTRRARPSHTLHQSVCTWWNLNALASNAHVLRTR